MRAKRSKVPTTQRGGRWRNEGYNNGIGRGRTRPPSLFCPSEREPRPGRTVRAEPQIARWLATLRRFGLVPRPLPGGQIQRLYRSDFRLRDDPDPEPIVRVQLRDSDGLGILSKENPDDDLQDSALKPDPNELAREPLGVDLIHPTHLRSGRRLKGINLLRSGSKNVSACPPMALAGDEASKNNPNGTGRTKATPPRPSTVPLPQDFDHPLDYSRVRGRL